MGPLRSHRGCRIDTSHLRSRLCDCLCADFRQLGAGTRKPADLVAPETPLGAREQSCVQEARRQIAAISAALDWVGVVVLSFPVLWIFPGRCSIRPLLPPRFGGTGAC